LNCSDADLVSRAQAGEVTAFDELVSRHQERVFVLAYRILGNPEDAADVQQETFVHAWTKLRQFRGEAAFPTWLHRITVNACLARKRRFRPHFSLEDDDIIAGNPHQTDCQDRLVNAVVVRQLLAGIPVAQRTLLVLREVEGMSIAEIAEVTGSSVDAVRKQLWRVRKLFGQRLRRQLMGEEG
jgi:RNA polymerase sigma-70 factor (ECF subfamily)